MRNLTTAELSAINGAAGYLPPVNQENEPLRNGLVDIGGYINHFIAQYTGMDLTGDTLEGNKILGFSAFVLVALVGTAALHFIGKVR